MFRNINVATRLGLAFGIVCLVILAVASAGYSGMKTLSQLAAHIAGVEGALAARAANIQKHALNLRRFEKDMFLTLADKAKFMGYHSKWQNELELLTDEWQTLEREVIVQKERDELSAKRRHIKRYEASLESVVANIQNGTLTTPFAADMAFEPYKDDARELELFAGRVADGHEAQMHASIAEVDQTTRRTFQALWLLVVAGLVVSVIVPLFTARSLTRPLAELAEVARALGSGRLDVQVRVSDRGDEIGNLMRAFHDMVGGMRTLISTLSSGVTQLSGNAEQIGATAQQYAASAQEQSAGVAEVSTTVEEIKQASQIAASSAKDVADSADAAARQGKKGAIASTRRTARCWR